MNMLENTGFYFSEIKDVVKMVELSPKQMLFVQAYLKNSNITAAAISAGYSERSASVTGSRMLKNANILAFLAKKEAKLDKDLRELFVEDALIAYKVLKEIMNKPEAQDKDRLVAARDLLDRAGYKPTEKVIADVNSEGTLTVVFDSGMG